MPIGFGPAALWRHARGVLGACSCLSSRAAGASWEHLSTPRRSTMPLSVLSQDSVPLPAPADRVPSAWKVTHTHLGPWALCHAPLLVFAAVLPCPRAPRILQHPTSLHGDSLVLPQSALNGPDLLLWRCEPLLLGSTVDVRCQVAAAEERACPREHPCRIVRSTPTRSAPTGPIRSRPPFCSVCARAGRRCAGYSADA